MIMERWRIELELEQLIADGRYDLANNTDVCPPAEIAEATFARLEALHQEVREADRIVQAGDDDPMPRLPLTLFCGLFVAAVAVAVVFGTPWWLYVPLGVVGLVVGTVVWTDWVDARDVPSPYSGNEEDAPTPADGLAEQHPIGT
jgi:hypothetical protein